jgi:hypothetical protein
MNAGTHITQQAPRRHQAFGRLRPCDRDGVSESFEIFKKTPFVAGLHSVGRDVVKDIPEIASIPLPATIAFDQDDPKGMMPGQGRPVAESPTAVKPHCHQDVLRSADTVSAVFGAIVGARGTLGASGSASGIFASFARSNSFAIAGASGLSAGDLENHHYADH